MKCRESEYLINDYIDGTITVSEKENLEKHLHECIRCQNTLKEIPILTEKLSALPVETEPGEESKAKIWENINNNINSVNASSNGRADYRTFGDKNVHPLNTERSIGRKFKMRYVLTGAAALILLSVTLLLIYNKDRNKPDELSQININPPAYWKVNRTGGAPSLKNDNNGTTRDINDIDSFTTGELILTDNSSSAEIQAGGIGRIKVEPGTKVRLISSSGEDHRIKLESGTIEAFINTKPRTFFVEMKSATAIDLGCSYTLTVSENGDGILYVKEGIVALQAHGRESLVPAGKFCISKEGIGPGTPYRESSSKELKDALMKFDFQNGGNKSINIILKNARKSDAVTLLNLLPRVDEANKGRVYERLTEFVPPPKQYPPDSIPVFNPDELTDWIEKMQREIHENLQNNIKDLQKQIENMKMNMNFEFDGGKFDKEFRFKWKNRSENDSGEVFDMDTLAFDKEEFQRELNEEMENVKTELEQVNKELQLNSEEVKKEMEKVKEEMKNMKIDIQIDMKGLNDEINNEIKKEMEKNKEEMKKHKEEMKKEKEKEKQEKEKEKEKEEKEEKEDQGLPDKP